MIISATIRMVRLTEAFDKYLTAEIVTATAEAKYSVEQSPVGNAIAMGHP
jgi:hypothetical protein